MSQTVSKELLLFRSSVEACRQRVEACRQRVEACRQRVEAARRVAVFGVGFQYDREAPAGMPKGQVILDSDPNNCGFTVVRSRPALVAGMNTTARVNATAARVTARVSVPTARVNATTARVTGRLSAQNSDQATSTDGTFLMISDPIVEEIHQIRKALSQRCNNDLHTICEAIRHSRRNSGHIVVSRPPRLVEQATVPVASVNSSAPPMAA